MRPIPTLRRLPWLAAAAALTLLCVPRDRARADDKSSLVSSINSLLDSITSELASVPGDSSSSDIDTTISYASQIADKARQLRDQAGDDSDARRIADYYPDYASHYTDAARYLREMKNQQRRNDELQRRCEDKQRELTERMRAFTDSPDPRGFEEIPRLARELGAVGTDALDKAERLRYEMASFYDRVDDFSDSDGRWSYVRNALIAAGQGLLGYAQQQQEQLKRDDTCGNLAKLEQNPYVVAAMAKLTEGKRGIELIYTDMDRQLGEIAGYLDRLEGDSNDADIINAENRLGELERNLDQLDRVRGNDGEARRRVETWRNIARAARVAWAQLHTLKQSQFAADRAPEKCGEAKQRLGEIIRSFVDVMDTDGKQEIPMRARALAGPIAAGLAKTDEQHPVMERALSDAQRFDPSEGRWRDVTEKHRASTSAMFDYWKRAREAAHAACDDLAKGDQNPDVVKALEQLDRTVSTNQRDLLQLEADYKAWYDGLQQLKSWYKQDTTSVREAFCNLEESPGDSEAGQEYIDRIDRVADRMRDHLRPEWSTITSRAATMTTTADTLIQRKDKDVQKRAEKVKTDIARVMGSLTNLMNDELYGSNDPQLRARMELGKNEHKRIQADSGKCTVAELTIGRRRIDCVRVSGSTCYVVEIKPNNGPAQDRGRAQITSGIEEIENALAGKKKKDELTGRLEVFRSCFDEQKGEADLKPELRVYEYCPPDGELYKDFVVP